MRAKHLTIMLTDIKGFTSRTAGQSRASTVALLKKHEELVLPVIREFSGTLTKRIGDAFLATFESPTDAVLCGLAIQDVLKAHNATCGPDCKIEIRVALNSGEVSVADDGDIYGDAVNMTARLEGIAEAGEVFITEAVYLTMNRNETGFQDRGYHSFKGSPEKIRVLKVLRSKSADNAEFGGNCYKANELKTETQGSVSEKDKEDARECFEKGLKYYFNEFEFAKAIDALKEAVDIDPLFLDAYFVLAGVAKSIGDDILVASVVDKLKKTKTEISEDRALRKIDIIIGRFELTQEYGKLVSRYSRQYTDDVFLCFLDVFSANHGNSSSLDAFVALRKKYMYIEASHGLHIEAEVEYYDKGNIERCLEILQQLVVLKPKNVNLHIGLLQVLIATGRIKQASERLGVALSVAPANEYLHMISGTLAYLRNDINSWFNIVHKHVGLTKHEDSLTSGLYYQLYLASEDAGRKSDADAYLQLARKYGATWEWQTTDDVAACMAKLELKDGLLRLSKPVLDIIRNEIINVNHRDLCKNRAHNKGDIYFNVYEIDRVYSGCRNIRIWTRYNYGPKQLSKSSVFVDSIPVSAFFNSRGGVIKCDFIDNRSNCDRYRAVLTYDQPLDRQRLEFLATELEASRFLRRCDGGSAEFELEHSGRGWGTRGYIFILPVNAVISSLSIQPDEIIEAGEFKTLIYTRFLYAFEKFLLRISLAGVPR